MVLNYKSFGQGDPIIILHGLFGTLDNWQTIAKKLAEHYTVFILDLRNHGKSPHNPEMDYAIMANDVAKFMEDNWIYESHMIGHSMGGKTAMQFALEYGDMLNKLIIVDIGPKAYVGGHQTIFEALHSIDPKKISDRKEADQLLLQKIPDFGVRQFLLKNLTREKDGGYRWKMNLPAINAAYPHILAKIQSNSSFEKDTLFIKGGKSDYLNQTDLPLIQELFPNTVLTEIENAGHWVHAEAPKKLLNTVLNFKRLRITQINKPPF